MALKAWLNNDEIVKILVVVIEEVLTDEVSGVIFALHYAAT